MQSVAGGEVTWADACSSAFSPTQVRQLDKAIADVHAVFGVKTREPIDPEFLAGKWDREIHRAGENTVPLLRWSDEDNGVTRHERVYKWHFTEETRGLLRGVFEDPTEKGKVEALARLLRSAVASMQSPASRSAAKRYKESILTSPPGKRFDVGFLADLYRNIGLAAEGEARKLGEESGIEVPEYVLDTFRYDRDTDEFIKD